jgi:lipopolysaccharide/colanic/teichoic acid biosynthesis glycosyltransferase
MNQAFAKRLDAQHQAPLPKPARSLERRRLQCYLALMVADILAVFVGFGSAGWTYLGSAGLAGASIQAQLILPVFLTIALYNGAYSIGALERPSSGILRALGALGIAGAFVVFVGFYTKSSQEFSRAQLTGSMILSVVAIGWLRLQMRAFVRWRCGEKVTNELLIADGGPALDLPGFRSIDAAKLGLEPNIDDPVALDRIGLVLQSIDRVVVSCLPHRRAAWAAILKSANIDGEVLDDAVAQLGAQGARIDGEHGFLRVSVGPLGLRMRAFKRLFDIAVAGAGLLVLSPVMILAALAILIEDGAPVLFVQRRVGRANRFFSMYKFRSMRRADNDRDGTASTLREDRRVTRVGRFIRRTSIDELPQLFNVLRGEMSIVGPRPHALGSQAGDKLFWEIDRRYWQRHALKPGLTGLAQIRGLRGATEQESDLAQRLNADLEYLAGWSLWRDVQIVAATLRVLVHPRAY